MDTTNRVKNILNHPNKLIGFGLNKIKSNKHIRNNSFLCKNLIVPIELSIMSNTPTRLIFEPISICNYSCYKCLYPEMEREKQSTDLIKYSLFLNKYKQKYGQFEVIELTGAGEILMYKDLLTLVKNTKKIMPNTRLTTTSNIALLNKSIAVELISSGLLEWQISLDSIDIDEYKKIVGKNISISYILNNIKMLWQTLQEINPEKSRLTILVHRPYTLDYSNKIKEIENEVKTYCTSVSSSPYQSLNARKTGIDFELSESKLFTSKYLLPCSYLWNDLAIISNGEVRICCSDMFDSPIELGNVFTDSIESVINNPTRLFYQDAMKKGKDIDKLYLCKHCHAPRT